MSAKPIPEGSGVCAYTDCRKAIPKRYGEPGVSLSRQDGKTLICSECGLREALGTVPPSRLSGGPVARRMKIRGRRQ